jgi:hypothetical protein
MNPKLTLTLSLLVGGISLTSGAQTPAPASTSPKVETKLRCDFVSATGFADTSRTVKLADMKIKCKDPAVMKGSQLMYCFLYQRSDLGDKPDELRLQCDKFQPK